MTKGTQAASELESVNLQSGGVSLSFPLASLPPLTGGKLGFTLSAIYNSKLWDGFTSERNGTTSQPGCAPVYTTKEVRKSDNGGWKIGAQYAVFFRNAKEDFDYLSPSSQLCYGNEYFLMQGKFFKPMLRLPDGSEYELRIEGSYPTYAGTRDHLANYYKYSGSSSDPQFSSPVRFYTTNGTFISIVYGTPTDTIKWTIYLKDGSRIEQSVDGQRTIDTNGNSVLVGFNTAGNYHFAKDESTGREIRWSAATYNSEPATKVEYQSVGGTWQSVWVAWGATAVRGKVYGKKSWNPQGGEFGQGDECYVSNLLEDDHTVVRKIVYPATGGQPSQEYSFSYNSDTSSQVTDTGVLWACGQPPDTYTRIASHGTGELSQVTTPSGAVIDYTYSNDGAYSWAPVTDTADDLVGNVIQTKSVTHDGSVDVWLYDIAPGGLATGGSVTNPDGSVFSEIYKPTETLNPHLGGDGYEGLQLRAKRGAQLIEKNWALLGGQMTAFGSPSRNISYNPVVSVEYTSLLAEDGVSRLKTSARAFQYDYNGELLQTAEYDWFDPSTVSYDPVTGVPTGVPSGATVLRVINTDYHNEAAGSASPTAYHKRVLGGSTLILGRPMETTVGTGTAVESTTRFSYDGGPYGAEPIKGNLTRTSMFDNVSNSWITSTATFSAKGNVVTATDGNGNVTQYTYGSINGYTDLYPTETIAAYGTEVARRFTAVYDFHTGLVNTATDADNNLSTVTEYDALGRPTKVRSAAGTPLESWVRTEYDAVNRRVITRADLETVGDGRKVAIQHYDQLGRVRLSRTLEDAAAEDPHNEQHGIKVETRYKTAGPCSFDPNATCSFQIVSNPFRAGTSSAAANEPTMGWTMSQTRSDGRYSETQTFSGAGLPAPFGGSNTASTGVVMTTSDANATTVEDQAGRQRRSITNALGQLVRVDEPTGAGLGAVNSPNQATGYAYDTLGNLTTVTQGVQTRTFTYSSLSRLLSATNPESGTVTYAYDANGNLTAKTDARSVMTAYTYDALNRVTLRSYSDSTPPVTYTYDNKTNAYGKLTKVSSSVSATEYTAFDILGRVTAHKQTTDGVDYTTGYSYGLAGQLLEQTYPSGRVVRNTFDTADGSLSQVQSKRPGETYRNFANGFVYNPAGAVTAVRLGNGLWENTVFNERLQPEQIGLGAGAASQSLLKLEYSYGGAANNGNVMEQKITVPGVAHPFIQTYTYDELNRIASAEETQNNSQTWKQAFTYDRYGNRNFNTSGNNTTTLPAGFDPTIFNPTVSTTNNRFASAQGYSYDSSGNTTADADGRTFIYDAENKQVSVSDANGTVGEYYYDGDGKRVKKYVPSTGETTVFVYDAGGKLIGEHSTAVQTGTAAKTVYTTNDHLGSPRINTDGIGQVVSRHDYHPFGEEIARTGYGSDTVRKQFTSYERDGETGLDFAQARYHNSSLGRFSSPDPYNIILEAKAESDPEKGQSKLQAYLSKAQQWNRYAYVINNPLSFVDPSGEILELTGTRAERDEAFNRIRELCGEGCGLLLREKDGRTFVEYLDHNGGPSERVALIGQVLEDIIDSSTIVELQVTSKATVTWADGDSENLSNRGALTRPISTDKIQIFISTTMSMETLADTAHFTGVRGEDGSKIPFERSVQLAHELGHAWGAIKDKFVERYNQSWIGSSVRNENNIRSVQVENWQRNRLGLPRRGNH